MQTSQTTDNILKALLSVQKVVKPFKKDGKGYNYKYISFDLLLGALKPILTDNDLILSQSIGGDIGEGGANLITCTTTLFHTSGEWIKSEELKINPLPQQKKEIVLPLTIRDLGSAMTYAKRYQLLGILGLAADLDDDGASVSTLLTDWNYLITNDQKQAISGYIKQGLEQNKYRELMTNVTGKMSTAELTSAEANSLIVAIREEMDL